MEIMFQYLTWCLLTVDLIDCYVNTRVSEIILSSCTRYSRAINRALVGSTRDQHVLHCRRRYVDTILR